MRALSWMLGALLLAGCNQKNAMSVVGVPQAVIAGRLDVAQVYPKCAAAEEPNTGLTMIQCVLAEKAPQLEGSSALLPLQDIAELSGGSVVWDTLTAVSGASAVPAQCQVVRDRLGLNCYVGFSSAEETILRVVLRLSKGDERITHMGEFSVAPLEDDHAAWEQYSGNPANLGTGNLWKFDPQFSGMQLLPN
jgi:hypothetical protein